MNIGIIGSGISGLSSAYILSKEHNVTLFEKNNKFGGHSNTISINDQGKSIPIDTGFIVFNKKNYINFLNFLKKLDVDISNSDMSFSVSNKDINFEYSGSLRGMIINYKNILNKKYYLMLSEIIRFYKFGLSYLINTEPSETVGEYLKRCNFSKDFCDYHLIPMSSSIWSTSENEIMNFPVLSLLQFFKNHVLLNLVKRPQWMTISNGSEVYVKKIIDFLKNKSSNKLFLNKKIVKIHKKNKKVLLTDNKDEKYTFDHVIFANHTDEACEILKNFDTKIFNILKSFRYQKNVTFLHSDPKFMPIKKLNWSSWNYLSNNKIQKSCVTYWMNKLQNINSKRNFFVTLNPIEMPDLDKTYKVISYYHPVYNNDAIVAQNKIKNFQGKNNVSFVGAWIGHGFHEDGIKSAINVCKSLNVEIGF